MINVAWMAAWIALTEVSAPAPKDWAAAMFNHTSHDFGVVARGAKVEHRFTLENIYLEDVRIASVHTTCQCTVPHFTKQILKTYEKGEIVATVDTRSFLGRKDATIRVVFDKPFPAEVQLHIYCYIRSDVVVEPGEVQFGTVVQGTSVPKKLTVSYAGRNDWKIIDVQSAQPHLLARVEEVSRGFGRVVYDLWIELKPDAPQGYLKDFIFLVTNDRNRDAARVPILVEGLIVGMISAQPSPLPLGIIQTSQTVTRNLVVQAKKPFRILSLTSPDTRIKLPNPPSEARSVHLIPVTFSAGDHPGEVHSVIQIRTDLRGGESLDVNVDGTILAPDSSAQPKDTSRPENPTPSPSLNPSDISPTKPGENSPRAPSLPGLEQDEPPKPSPSSPRQSWKPVKP